MVHTELTDVLKMLDDSVTMFETEEVFWKQKFIEDIHHDLDFSLSSELVGWKNLYNFLKDFQPQIYIWG